jgi:transcriptional regulator with XRE-family HTH domain
MSENGKQLAIGEVADRAGMSASRIRYYEARGVLPAPERLRELALAKLPELDELIERAASVRRLLEFCSDCDCHSIDVCPMFDLTSTRVEV